MPYLKLTQKPDRWRKLLCFLTDQNENTKLSNDEMIEITIMRGYLVRDTSKLK